MGERGQNATPLIEAPAGGSVRHRGFAAVRFRVPLSTEHVDSWNGARRPSAFLGRAVIGDDRRRTVGSRRSFHDLRVDRGGHRGAEGRGGALP